MSEKALRVLVGNLFPVEGQKYVDIDSDKVTAKKFPNERRSSDEEENGQHQQERGRVEQFRSLQSYRRCCTLLRLLAGFTRIGRRSRFSSKNLSAAIRCAVALVGR